MRRQIWSVYAVDHFERGAFHVLVLDPDADGAMTAEQAVERVRAALGRAGIRAEVGGAIRHEESSDAHGVFLALGEA